MFELPSPDAPLTKDDLRAWTNKMIDHQREQIAGCTDADVVFQPIDPKADDPYAADAADVNLPWTLGHLIVHITASSEESAALAAELARGVAFHGRSRSEVPWQTVTTIQQCVDRLEESRRMRLASLDMWPDNPDAENGYTPWEGAPFNNCYRRFIGGLRHDNSHLDQIEDVVGQAQAARVQA
ncbi:MAG: DinB family protein [Anaerolineae bacterium]